MEKRNRDHPAACTFCELIHGSAEVSICHEDADAIAFMDIQPVNNGHVLVVPREHHESLREVPEELGAHLFRVTMRLANAIRQVTGCEDMNIVVNSGAAAGQDEPHYHVHIIPRRPGDGFDIPLPFNGSSMPDRTVLDAYAVQIISALRDPVRDAGREEEGVSEGKSKNARDATASGTDAGAVSADQSRVTAAPQAPDAPERRTKAFRADRAVEMPVYNEGAIEPAGGPPESGRHPLWSAEEGPHGELRYHSPSDHGDAV